MWEMYVILPVSFRLFFRQYTLDIGISGSRASHLLVPSVVFKTRDHLKEYPDARTNSIPAFQRTTLSLLFTRADAFLSPPYCPRHLF
jgi:hypothetical protein